MSVNRMVYRDDLWEYEFDLWAWGCFPEYENRVIALGVEQHLKFSTLLKDPYIAPITAIGQRCAVAI